MWLATTWACAAMIGTIVLTGTVENHGGKPVEGASVWLVDADRTEPGADVLAEGKTDAAGGFQLDRANDLAGRGAFGSSTLWAHKPGARLAYREFRPGMPGLSEPVRLDVTAEGLLVQCQDRARRDLPDARRGSRWIRWPASEFHGLRPPAARLDRDRSRGYLGFAIASRAPRSMDPMPGSILPWDRQQSVDLAELAMILAHSDRSAAEAVFAPVAELDD